MFFRWLRGLGHSLSDFRTDPLEDYVADSMFSDAKKLSDFIGFLARSAFCGFATAFLANRFQSPEGTFFEAFGALVFMILGIGMYLYAIQSLNDFIFWRLRLADKKRNAIFGLAAILFGLTLGIAIGKAILELAEKAAL